ncbi:doxorubicin resistance ABC transporter permease protein drrB [Mycobacterium kansasii 732]|nr:doxorubicin resistance ABC transporter permease protein drrB [Mycobacterium kansasii 732]
MGFSPTVEKLNQSTLRQWRVLISRLFLRTSIGELFTTAGAPVVFMVGFYIPFAIPWNHFVGGASSGVASNLGQYITPLVTLQAISFAAIGSGFRAATDSLLGVNRRFSSMPIAPVTPVLARATVSVYRCSIGLAVSLVCGYVIGFRFHRGALYIVGFCVLVLAIGPCCRSALTCLAPLPRTPTPCCPC